jgi:hypothetical protein
LARDSRPYIPLSTPGYDVLTRTLIEGYDPTSPIDTVQRLMIEADRATSMIGSIVVEPLELTNDLDSPETPNRTSNPPPVWFDPESRRPATDYEDVPIAVGKSGNIITGGRLISPTIDEIWIAIKQLAGGRNIDPSQSPTAIDTPDIGYPVGVGQGNPDGLDRSIPRDTRFTLKRHRFTGDDIRGSRDDKVGDPIRIDHDFSENPGRYSVQSWINDPSRIEYKFLAEIEALNTRVTTDQTATGGFGTPISTMRPNQDQAFAANYNPSRTIWSNREIEAAIKGLRYNVAGIARFFEINAAYAGRVGRPNADPNSHTNANVARGTAYTLHRNYDPATHNTVYDNRHDSGVVSPPTRGVGVKLLEAAEIPDFQLRGTRTNYPAASAYIAADGFWRSTWQMVNIPVISRETEPF